MAYSLQEIVDTLSAINVRYDELAEEVECAVWEVTNLQNEVNYRKNEIYQMKKENFPESEINSVAEKLTISQNELESARRGLAAKEKELDAIVEQIANWEHIRDRFVEENKECGTVEDENRKLKERILALENQLADVIVKEEDYPKVIYKLLMWLMTAFKR